MRASIHSFIDGANRQVWECTVGNPPASTFHPRLGDALEAAINRGADEVKVTLLDRRYILRVAGLINERTL